MATYAVASKVKEFVKKAGMNSASDLVDALDRKIEAMLKQAVERAKANGRKTVRSHDL